ncbi:ABC-type branched-subunit amino acid transport system ATPase component [Paraburkholderia youngii]
MSALLDIRDLNAWYGASQALHGVTLSIEPGEVIALVGRNGSGRSTLARAIMGLVRCEGELRFAGRSLAGLPHVRDRAARARLRGRASRCVRRAECP